MANGKGVSGWVGWVYFAAFFLVLEGMFQLIAGLVLLFNQDVVVATDKAVWFVDVATWGWAYLLIGTIVLFAGIALFKGETWARVLAVIFACISAVVNFMFIPIYPVWAIIVLTVDVLVIYAVLVHGAEAKKLAE